MTDLPLRTGRPARSFAAALAVLLSLLLLFAVAARAETLTAGNGFYNVDVNNENGQYTVTTGPSHPLGEGLNVLFGDGSPETSFDTVRSYASHTDYDLRNVPSSTVPLGSTGFQTTYTISGEDSFTVVQTVRVDGVKFEDSRVEVTTVVTNNGGTSVPIGVRYLWDYQINEDDGPTFQQNNPDGPVLLTEQEFPSPGFQYYTIEDNDVSPSPPTFDVLGTVTGPAGADPVPPTLLKNVSWPEAFGTAFDYTTGAETVSSQETGPNDNAVLYYWGDTEADAPMLAPGASYRASASMFLTRAHEGLPHEPPPPPPPASPSPAPAVQITKGPAHETSQPAAVFDFTGTPGGAFECKLDGGRWKPCKSGEEFGPVQPGDHLFQVREVLGGVTSAPAGYRWTVDLPRRCVLRVARARVFVFTKKSKTRLVIHYTSYKPARVTVSYALKGSKGGLSLGSAVAKFKKAGVFRLPVSLTPPEIAKVRAAKSFRVKFKIAKTPALCGRYYTKQLTIPRQVSGQTVWFQSDSLFAPGA